MMEKINYQGWPNSIRRTNARAELILTTDVGPRAIRFAFPGQSNEFHENEDWVGRSGGTEYHSYGGHRLWLAPESPGTMFPDNRSVAAEETTAGLRLLPPPEAATGIQKEWLVRLFADQARVRIRHRLTNTGRSPVTLAPWAITVMAPGGAGVLPLPPRRPHPGNLLPTGRLALWPYTDMSDPRWTWGEKYILLRQDVRADSPQKIGISGTEGWIAYCRGGHLFLKLHAHQPDAEYPDQGSSAEMFTNGNMLELETLGPLLRLDPGKSVDHWEEWFLFDSVPVPARDADVERDILPRVELARRAAALTAKQGAAPSTPTS